MQLFLLAATSSLEMNNSGAAPDQKPAVEFTKDRNGIDQVILNNPRGASVRVRFHQIFSVYFMSREPAHVN